MLPTRIQRHVSTSTSVRIILALLAVALVLNLRPPSSAFAASTVTLDWNNVHQTIDGFGASGAFQRAAYLMNFPEPQRTTILNALFSQTSGAGLSIVRNIVGDGSPLGDGVPTIEPSLNNWVWTGDEGQIWLMQQAQTYGADRIMSTVWSPPAWMKTNGSVIGGSLSTSHYQHFADYLSRYIREYQSRFGMEIEVISLANEPCISVSYSSCCWTGPQFRDFIKNNLIATFAADGVTAKVMIGEKDSWSETIANESLADPVSAAAVDIVAGHHYSGSIVPFSNAISHGKQVWETEVSYFSGNDSSITDGIRWAREVHNFMRVDTNAFLYWWFVNEKTDGEGLVNINQSTHAYTLNKRLFTLGNYARFVRPDYVRFESTASPATGIYTTAYRDPDTGQFAVVVINENYSAQTIDLTPIGFSASSVTPYVTDSTRNLVQLANVPLTGISLAARSVTTFVGTVLLPTNTPTTTATPTVTATITRTPTRTSTLTRTPTVTLTPTRTSTITLTPTLTSTATLTATDTSTATQTSTITHTPTDTTTVTQTPTVTLTQTETSTETSTSTVTLTPTDTATVTQTPTVTLTPTETSTETSTSTVTLTPTETSTVTQTPTVTLTQTETSTETSTSTVTLTPTETSTVTQTPTITLTQTETSTETGTSTVTLTPTETSTVTQTPTITLTQTETSTETGTSTVTRTPTRTPTVTRTPSNTRTPTRTSTETLTPTDTETKTSTPTKTSTDTETLTPTGTTTATDTGTLTPSPSDTFTTTHTLTVTFTRTLTTSRTQTRTPTQTATNTATATATSTPTPIPTYTPTLSRSATLTLTFTPTPTETTPPLPGAFGKAAPGNASYALINPILSWDPSSNADGYEYCIDAIDNGACDSSWNSIGSATSVTINGLGNNHTYFWQVRAVNGNGTTYADGGIWWTFIARRRTFADVPIDHPLWVYIEAFYGAGITTGCGVNPLIFCPEQSVTRASMAVFLLRAMHGSSYAPPPADHFFADLPVAGKEWMEPWVDEFYRQGITTGCGTGPLIYCPESAVKRQAMAAFIVRAFGLPLPPPA
jgi:glucuronoarabinoxylan endo-1,4-beta-xylanase